MGISRMSVLPKPYYQDSAVTIYNCDCSEVPMPQIGFHDLLLTDPPYGIGESGKRAKSRGRGSKLTKGQDYLTDYGDFNWDQERPSMELLKAYIRQCAKSCIWGANYFELPPCVGPLIWDKENSGDFADGEMAWNDFGTALRIKRHLWNGMLRKGSEFREHPTQKPVEVMTWCIGLADKALKRRVETVIDPFGGSGTTARAAKDMGRKCVMIEREESYCEIAARRMGQEVLDLQ